MCLWCLMSFFVTAAGHNINRRDFGNCKANWECPECCRSITTKLFSWSAVWGNFFLHYSLDGFLPLAEILNKKEIHANCSIDKGIVLMNYNLCCLHWNMMACLPTLLWQSCGRDWMTFRIPISLLLVLEFKLCGVKMGNGELLFDIPSIVCV